MIEAAPEYDQIGDNHPSLEAAELANTKFGKDLILDPKNPTNTIHLLSTDTGARIITDQEEFVELGVHPLTKLPNRLRLENRLTQEIERSRRYNRPLSIAFVDADGLKHVNDTKGHNAGDSLLIHIAKILKLRKTDLVFHPQGDEFIIIFLDTDINKTNEHGKLVSEVITNNLRTASIENPFVYPPTDDQPDFSCQACFSIGFASYQPEDTLESLLDRADAAMQADKNARRNADRSLHIRE